MQAEKGEKRTEVQKVKLNRKRNLNQHKGGRKKMSNGEHEIRTPKGLRIGNRSVVDGKNMLQIKRGGCEDYISAESLVFELCAENQCFRHSSENVQSECKCCCKKYKGNGVG